MNVIGQGFLRLVIICATLSVFGCTSFGSRRGSDERSLVFAQSVAHIPHKNISVSRADLKDAINRGPVAMRIRLVELFSGASSTPRYRVMGYDQLGPYKYLGLEVGDVILAANNLIMRQPSVFPDYVRLLSDTNNGTIHIIRKGQEYILAYTIS